MLMTLLLVMSGNPIISTQTWVKNVVIVVGLLLFIVFRKQIRSVFIKHILQYLSFFFIIFFFQYLTLGFISIPFVFGFIIRVFTGALIIYLLRDRFSSVFFETIFWISLISFPFYIFHFIVGDDIIDQVQNLTNTNSIGFYTFRSRTNDLFLRNSGMFWEPGVFQAYINLVLFLNLNRIKYLWKKERFKVIIILIALLSTQSTTGYITFFVIMTIYSFIYIKKYNIVNKLVIFFVVVIISSLLYNNVSFLGDKIENQFNEISTTDKDFTNGRFGSLLFDLHYIQKHPLIGNGFHEKTRYADHPWMIKDIQSGISFGFSNGLSGFISSAGFLGMGWYFFLIIYWNNRRNIVYSLLLCFIIIILLFGEPLLNFSLFLGLPFLVNSTRYKK